MFIKYKSMTIHFLLVSFIACYCSHSYADYQASRALKPPGCPHGVPHHHGVCLTSARRGGAQ